MTEQQVSKSVTSPAYQLWLASLGAVVTLRDGGSKVFDSCIKEGEKLQTLTRESAQGKIKTLKVETGGALEKWNEVLQQQAQRILNHMGLPSNDDIRALSSRVAALNKRVEELSKQ
jgi:poly(hydroxyalkanoate) granule-associated protein